MRNQLGKVFLLLWLGTCHHIFAEPCQKAFTEPCKQVFTCNEPWVFNNPSWYVGAGGLVIDNPYISSVSVVGVSFAAVDDTLFNSVVLNTPSYGYQVFVGYNANSWIGVEFRFLQLASPQKLTEVSNYTISENTEGSIRLYKSRAINFGPASVFYIPISKYFTPYIKCGIYAIYYAQYWKYSPEAVQFTLSTLHTRTWSIRMMAAYGISSQISKWLSLRLEYDCPTNQIMNNAGRLIHGNLNLSTVVTF